VNAMTKLGVVLAVVATLAIAVLAGALLSAGPLPFMSDSTALAAPASDESGSGLGFSFDVTKSQAPRCGVPQPAESGCRLCR
jgi:hypothetical protein